MVAAVGHKFALCVLFVVFEGWIAHVVFVECREEEEVILLWLEVPCEYRAERTRCADRFGLDVGLKATKTNR